MKKEEVLGYLQEALDDAKRLEESQPGGEEHTRWLLTTKALLKQVFGEDSDFYRHFQEIRYAYEGDSRFDSWYYRYEMDKLAKAAFQKGLSEARGVLSGALEHVRRFGLGKVSK